MRTVDRPRPSRRAFDKRCPCCDLKIDFAAFLCPYCRGPLVPFGRKRPAVRAASWPSRISAGTAGVQSLLAGWALGAALLGGPDAPGWASVQAAGHAAGLWAALAWTRQAPWGRTAVGWLSMVPLLSLALGFLLPRVPLGEDPRLAAAALMGLVPLFLALMGGEDSAP